MAPPVGEPSQGDSFATIGSWSQRRGGAWPCLFWPLCLRLTSISSSTSNRAMQLQHHVFWSCHVASSIRRATLLSALPPTTTLPCSAVWLLRAPSGVHAGVWSVVCAAAVEAMAFGHRFLWALHRAEVEREECLDPTHSLNTAFFLTPLRTWCAGPFIGRSHFCGAS